MIGLGAVSAAVMSSCDSSCLAMGTLFSQNAYIPLRKGLSSVCGVKEVWIMEHVYSVTSRSCNGIYASMVERWGRGTVQTCIIQTCIMRIEDES